MAPTKVLVTGVTGYIGGSILSHLLSNAQFSQDLEISVLTRDDDRAKAFSSDNLKVFTIRDLDDFEAIKAASSQNDVVIHTASGYHTRSAAALIEGLGVRQKQNPNARVYYIHTSGTSNLGDRPVTKIYSESRVFSDKDQDIFAYLKMREHLEPYAQRTTDIVVVETGKRENVPTTIIMSPTIYGTGSGKYNRLSIQYPIQMKTAAQKGRAEYVGDGEGVWDFVHVLDLAELYGLVLADWVQQKRTVPVGEQGIIFSATGEATWKEVAEGISKAGVEIGRLQNVETRSVGLKEAAQEWTRGDEQLCELGWASNSRTRAEVAKELEWKPSRTKEDWERSFVQDFQELLAKGSSA
ncbi:NAD(P)-binding protein [Xylaria grammica]|nr:NAD(P)-binding protein [Xylaria grammica]